MLQQEAANKLGFTTKKTMMIAQELYEGIDIDGEGTVGLISYIRTDSKRISDEAREKAKEFILEEYSEKYYKFEEKKKAKAESKKVQDAHEAIRPTSVERTPDNIKASLSKDQYKLYDLIWRRFVASQMEDSVFDTLNLTCKVDNVTFKATGSKLKFDGYTKVYNLQIEKIKYFLNYQKMINFQLIV
ncbi:DNA topoisomerase family protein [[Clostridium] sordellii ATCC 9714]|nr:DNA topoisomerase family protein [[Clostridium] sordellii ATCC 9714] [Paeniclostridium sordellii ATCC 9714]